METDGIDSQQGDNATGGEIDLSTFGVEPTVDATQASADGDNPNWEPFFKVIPAEFQTAVKPILKDWDNGVNERFRQVHADYAPYKAFKDRGVDPEDLERRYQIAEQIQTDPVAFFNNMQQVLIQRGLLQQQQEAAAAATTPDDPQFDPDDPYNARIEELRAEIQQRDASLAQFLQEQQQQEVFEKEVQTQGQIIDSSFQAIEQRVGPMSEPLKKEIVSKALFMSQTQNRPVTIEEATAEVLKFIQATRSSVKPGPRTIPTGGSIPQINDIPASEMTAEQRYAKAVEIRERVLGAQG